ncbi:MAG TPA: SIMPL domain-containing protein [Anaerolineales bacterium]|nr:SIMPL domain-containing protein [Anaerolineales bacterium]
MESKPDTIKVSAMHREEIYANHANLFVIVKGSSVFSGNEAMKKAKEVNQLVEALTNFGLSPDAVQLQGVRIETASGTLLKSSSAIYHLKIHNEKLDQLPGLLDIIASQKNATLERIEWKYPEESARERGLDAAITQAKSKANKVAATLGVRLLGVYDFIENAYDEERPVPMPMQAMMMKSRAAEMAADAPSLDMDIQHSKTIHVNLEIWYRISEFGNM